MKQGGRRQGAGRPTSKRLTTELRHIDVRDVSEADRLPLSTGALVEYRYGATLVEARLQATATPCHYGGERVWFVCHGCTRRVARLYLGASLACRQCLELTYPSQRKDVVRRGWSEQRKIEARLAAEEEWNGWQKPRGMHWQTFAKLTARLRELDHARNVALTVEAGRLGLICP